MYKLHIPTLVSLFVDFFLVEVLFLYFELKKHKKNVSFYQFNVGVFLTCSKKFKFCL